MRDGPDILVVGGGPAGSTAALTAARLGARVWLVDRALFPRDKVCGCCLNQRAVARLEGLGLGDVMGSLHGRKLEALELHAGGRHASVRLPGGVAVSRSALDNALIEQVAATSARVLTQTDARVASDGLVTLCDKHGERTVRPGCVIVADGLSGRSLAEHGGFVVRQRAASWIGLGAVLDEGSGVAWGRVVMACGRQGYAGMVRLEDGRTDVAAAVSPDAVREAGGAVALLRSIFDEAGVEAPRGLEGARVIGTPRLTRQRVPLFAERVLLVGDAAGYVEPFTGEGMAWAIAGGAAVVPHALRAAESWDAGIGHAWTRAYRKEIGRRQIACRAIACLLHRPWAMRLAVGVLAGWPAVADPILNHLNRPREAHHA